MNFLTQHQVLKFKMNVLKLKFQATNYNGWPKLRFCVDNDVLQEFDFVEEEGIVELELDLFDGEHTLEIERYGKTHNNINFVDGQVLADQIVELVDLYVDNVKLSTSFKFQGTFYFEDQIVPSGLLWGPNGKYIWKFQTPIIAWIVNEKNKVREPTQDLITPGKPETQKVYEKLDEFERLLDNIKI